MELGLLYTESKMQEQAGEYSDVGVIQGGVGTPVHGAQDVRAGWGVSTV